MNRISYPLDGLYIYLTDSCNLKCRHCWVNPEHRDFRSRTELGYDMFCKVIEEAKPLGLSFVRLTGGEPLLHSQFEKFINFIKKVGLILDIETNGTLIGPEIAARLGKIAKTNIAVSLDGPDSTTHDAIRGVKGSFHKTFAGILNLKRAGVTPELITCLFKGNKDRILEMIRVAEDLRVRSLNFKFIAPIGRGETLFSSHEVLSVEELVGLGKWFETELIPRSKIHLTFSQPPAFVKISTLIGARKKTCGICGITKILGVLPNGDFALCGIGMLINDLRFGNAAADEIAGVWHNHKIIREIREGLPDKLGGICRFCMMKALCRGSCLAQNYYLGRDLWSSYWYCEQAHALGLFPESRIIKPV